MLTLNATEVSRLHRPPVKTSPMDSALGSRLDRHWHRHWTPVLDPEPNREKS